jgi:hypothetical protein
MLASKDFGFMLAQGIATMLLQLWLLSTSKSISAIYTTFTIRLGSYALSALVRAALGRGNLGRVLRQPPQQSKSQNPDGSSSVPPAIPAVNTVD